MQSQQGKNYNFLQIGNPDSVKQQMFTLPGMGEFSGKYFLKEPLALTSMEASINVLPAGAEVPFKHRHKNNEELYFFIKGKGEFEIDGTQIEIKEGSMIRVSPNGIRTWRNNGNEDLYYFVIQAKANSMERSTFEDGELVK